jgi:hypothetical protein
MLILLIAFARKKEQANGNENKTRRKEDKLEIRFWGLRLTQLYFNSCLLFYSNYPLHVSVVRGGNIYTSEINMTDRCIYFQ